MWTVSDLNRPPSRHGGSLSNDVDLGGIGPPFDACHATVLPLNYGPTD